MTARKWPSPRSNFVNNPPPRAGPFSQHSSKGVCCLCCRGRQDYDRQRRKGVDGKNNATRGRGTVVGRHQRDKRRHNNQPDKRLGDNMTMPPRTLTLERMMPLSSLLFSLSTKRWWGWCQQQCWRWIGWRHWLLSCCCHQQQQQWGPIVHIARGCQRHHGHCFCRRRGGRRNNGVALNL